MSVPSRRACVLLATVMTVSVGLAAPGGPVQAAEPDHESLPGEFVESAPTQHADVSIDRWDGVWGQSVADVPIGAEPDASYELFGELESPVGIGDQYATRLRTLLTPDTDGLYRFWISGDDDVRLFLDPTGDDPAEARLVAYIAGWTDYRQFDRFWSQRSIWFELRAGQSYYVELIGKEGSGGDHFTVAWEEQGGFDREVVPASVLSATELGAGGWRSATPVGLPEMPAPMIDPQWSYTAGPETLAVSWAQVEGAEWYDVRLEGGGQALELTVDVPRVDFDNLLPESRYLIEVAPGSAAGRQPARSRVLMTTSGPYPTPVAAAPAGERASVSYDRWDTGWWTLTSVPEGAAPATTATLRTGLETPPMLGENHAARLRAILTPAVTGAYRLVLAADDDARLILNPNGPTAAGAGTVAYVAGWTEQYQWDRFRSQTSDVFNLVAGRQYYVEAVSVHGLGLDHLEVGWSLDGGAIEVIPAHVLTPTTEGAGGWRRHAAELEPSPEPVLPAPTTTTTTTTVPPTTVPTTTVPTTTVPPTTTTTVPPTTVPPTTVPPTTVPPTTVPPTTVPPTTAPPTTVPPTTVPPQTDLDVAADGKKQKADKALEKALKAFGKAAKNFAEEAGAAADDADEIAREADKAADAAERDRDKAVEAVGKAKNPGKREAAQSAAMSADAHAQELRRIADSAAAHAAAAQASADLAEEWAEHVSAPCEAKRFDAEACIATEVAGLSVDEGRVVLVGTGAPALVMSDQQVEALTRAAAKIGELLG